MVTLFYEKYNVQYVSYQKQIRLLHKFSQNDTKRQFIDMSAANYFLCQSFK